MNTYTKLINLYSLIILAMTVLFLPYSTAVLEIGAYLSMFLFLIGGQWSEKWALIQSNRLIQVAIILYLYICIRVIGTDGTYHLATKEIATYSKLLLIPIVMFTIMKFPKWQSRIVWLFVAAMVINLTCGYLKYYAGVHFPIGDKSGLPAAVFIGHITLSFFVSIAIFILLLTVFTEFKSHKVWQNTLYIVLLLFFTHYLLFMTIGRSGYVTLLIFGLYLLYRMIFTHKKVVATILLILTAIAAAGIAFKYSTTLTQRLSLGLKNIQQYDQGHIHTSWAERLDFWKNAIKLTKQAPIFGHGTGSMHQVYYGLSKTETKIDLTNNTHEQYLFFSVEQGILATVLFLILLYLAFKSRPNTDSKIQFLREGFVLAYAVGCLYNSWLHDVHEGYLGVVLMAVLHSTPPTKSDTQPQRILSNR